MSLEAGNLIGIRPCCRIPTTPLAEGPHAPSACRSALPTGHIARASPSMTATPDALPLDADRGLAGARQRDLAHYYCEQARAGAA
jgi:hypothetical protein